MKRLEFSRDAEADVIAILSYGTRLYGEETADSYYFGLLAAFEFLCRTPFAGQVEDRSSTKPRRWRYGQHRILYYVTVESVRIVRVLHQSADVKGKIA